MNQIFAHIDFYGFAMFFLTLVILLWFKRLPSIDSYERFLHSLDSRGGNILILTGLTWYSASQAIKLFWHLIYLVHDGKLQGNDGVTQVAISFVTTTLAGGFSGALIKTLTGMSDPITIPPQPVQTPTENNGGSENGKTSSTNAPVLGGVITTAGGMPITKSSN